MNQILSEETPVNRKKKGKKASVHSILVTFSIFLLIFGVGLVSTGAYSYYRTISEDSRDGRLPNSTVKPEITIERENANTINITVTSDKGISKVTYTLNDNKAEEFNANDELIFSKKVTLPSGKVKLTIIAEDINGVKSSRESSYEIEAGPTITLKQVESKIQITTESEINIKTVKYYWDDNEDEATEFSINDVKNVTQVDAIEGVHTLVIVATDINGNISTKTQKIIGDTKPTLDISTDGENFYIVAKDDESLAKIQYKLNSEEVITEQIDGKEYSKSIKLESGENKLIVRVYNKNNIEEVAKVRYVKE